MSQMSARFHNNTLRHPHSRIKPVASFHPDRGAVHPDLSLFPNNANEFYALRTCSTPHQQQMLHYLIKIYDISVQPSRDSDDDEWDDDTSDDVDPSSIVDSLEAVLGLDKEKFIRFLERASQRAREAVVEPVKRYFDEVYLPKISRKKLDTQGARNQPTGPHLETFDLPLPAPVQKRRRPGKIVGRAAPHDPSKARPEIVPPPKMSTPSELRFDAGPEEKKSSSDETRLGWRAYSDASQPMLKLESRLAEERVSDDVTNADTLSREYSILQPRSDVLEGRVDADVDERSEG
ncbi:hypothetical protein FDECE_11182 [Fusarium decemcellulare]|nr:hypothetical protein FDECE_11182 [Fusarium decemcellulare]